MPASLGFGFGFGFGFGLGFGFGFGFGLGFGAMMPASGLSSMPRSRPQPRTWLG